MDWQVESGSRTTVFLSATTSDLGECRRLVAGILQQAGIFPVIQDFFGPDHRTIEDMIYHKIMSSDAVICLVGHTYGASPSSEDIERSYTQIEYDIASRYEKPIYLFIASDEYLLNNPINEPRNVRIKQEEHRRAILSGSRKYQFFSSAADLERQIYSLIRPLLEHSGRRSIKFEHIPPAPACFVGRIDEMAELNYALDKKLPSVIVLLGMGGQGKSTLVAQTLKSRNSLPFTAGIWVSAELGGFTFSEFLDCALETFMGSRFDKTEMPRIDTRTRKLISILQAKPLLIVIDAIERWLIGWKEDRHLEGIYDVSQRQEAYDGLDEFLKEITALESGSHIVLTSRVLPAVLDVADCAILPVVPKDKLERGLPALSQDAAIELLKRLGVIAPEEKLRQVAQSLVNHPLALTGFARVASRLGENWESLLSGRSTDPSNMFHKLLDETRKHLPDRTRSEQLLKIVSLIPEGAKLEALEWLMQTKLFQKTSNNLNFLSQVLTLADWNLLTWDASTQSVRLHALIAEYFSELLDPTEQTTIHDLISKWYEIKTNKTGMTADGASNRIHALRHAIAARNASRAMSLIFESDANDPNLVDWLLFNGHLWECSELLFETQHITEDLDKVSCILTRTKILHELELSQLTIADLKEAAGLILNHSKKSSPFLQFLMAQCYGLQGLIHLETSKATEALLLLDKSVVIFESLGRVTNDYLVDLAKTLANRGLARWCCGDWDEADLDYSRSIKLLEKTGQSDQPDLKLMIQELHARQAALNLDRGDAAKAVSGLEDVVHELKLTQTNIHGRPTKNYFMTLVSLAAAFNEAKTPAHALEVIKNVILPLEEMARQGRWEYDSILAQAHVNETNALLQLEKLKEAKKSSDQAILIFEELIEKGASQFSGPLAHALFRRSEAFILLREEAEGLNDIRRALVLSKELLLNWFGETNIDNVYLKNALRVISFLPEENIKEKHDVLLLVRDLIGRLESSSRQSEAMLLAKKMVSFNWLTLKSMADNVDIQWPEMCPFVF